MAAWTQRAPQWPASAEALHARSQPLLTALDHALDAAATRLQQVPPHRYRPDPSAEPAAALAPQRQALHRVMQSRGHLLLVHPWQQGIGEGEGRMRYLSAPNAIEALAAKWRDGNDHRRPQGDQEAVALLFAAGSLHALHTHLAAFHQVFALDEIGALVRRTQQHGLSDADNTHALPEAALNAPWLPRALTQYAVARQALVALDAPLAEAHALSSAAQPLAQLQRLIEKKRAQLRANAEAAQALRQGMNGPVLHRLWLPSGDADTQAQRLLASRAQAPGHDAPFSVALMFAAPPGQLDAFREVFT